jgi:hypothetical protein
MWAHAGGQTKDVPSGHQEPCRGYERRSRGGRGRVRAATALGVRTHAASRLRICEGSSWWVLLCVGVRSPCRRCVTCRCYSHWLEVGGQHSGAFRAGASETLNFRSSFTFTLRRRQGKTTHPIHTHTQQSWSLLSSPRRYAARLKYL